MNNREFLLKAISDYYNGVVVSYQHSEYTTIKYDNNDSIGKYLYFYIYKNHKKPSDIIKHHTFPLYTIETLAELLQILEKDLNDI